MEILGFPIREERKTDNGCWDYRPGYSVSLFPLSQWDTAFLLDALTSLPCLWCHPVRTSVMEQKLKRCSPPIGLTITSLTPPSVCLWDIQGQGYAGSYDSRRMLQRLCHPMPTDASGSTGPITEWGLVTQPLNAQGLGLKTEAERQKD